MPELPEVQTVVSDLQPILPGLKFVGLSSKVPKVVLPSVDAFENLEGLRVLEVFRRGKFICILFENEKVVTIHLRMTGRIIVSDAEDEALPFERNRLDFSNGVSLRFCDMRKFGRVWLSNWDRYEEDTGIYKLGVEPLSEEFTLEKFKELFDGRNGNVKRLLLDQSLIAGVGNIYADESCFYAGVRPDKEAKLLEERELNALHEAVIKALMQGIRNRGTSVSDYADAYGKSGKNQELLYVYGRGGKECLRCGELLVKCKVAGRGTVYCEGCQG